MAGFLLNLEDNKVLSHQLCNTGTAFLVYRSQWMGKGPEVFCHRRVRPFTLIFSTIPLHSQFLEIFEPNLLLFRSLKSSGVHTSVGRVVMSQPPLPRRTHVAARPRGGFFRSLFRATYFIALPVIPIATTMHLSKGRIPPLSVCECPLSYQKWCTMHCTSRIPS